MTVLNVVKYPNKILKQKAQEIEEISEEIEKLAHDMLETMYTKGGIGLAGNQVGVLLRIVVIDLQHDEEDPNPLILINPEIIWKSEELEERDEGCLSIIGISAILKRPAKVKVSYMNIEGKKKILEADGLLSTCLQHEIDHLDGIVFIDRLSKLKRDMAIKKYKKLQEENQEK